MSWPLVTLSDVAQVESGDPAPQGEEYFAEDGVPFVRAGSLVPLLDGSTERDLEHIPESVSAKLRMTAYPANTVVFAKSGMSCTKGLIYQLRSEAHVVSHLAAIVCGEELSPDFLRHWYRVNSPTRLIDNSSYPSIKISAIRAEQILLPPLAEQKRIAAILDAADALRAKRREALAQLDILLQATFLDLFGDPVTNPKGWASKPLEDVLHPDRPISYGILKPGDYEVDGVIMLRIQDIRGGRVGEEDLHRVPSSLSNQYKRTLLSGGEVVISLVGTIGLCALIPSRFAGSNVHRNLAVLAPSKLIDSAFLFRQMVSDQFQRQIRETTKGGSQPLLNLGDLKRLPVLVPPIDEQMRFRRFFESHERQEAMQGAHLAELDTLFASLQSRAFRGEL